jgi:general secretion pathway protein G
VPRFPSIAIDFPPPVESTGCDGHDGLMRPRARGPLASAGFTLFEAMLVVALIGVLAAVALPSYKSYADRAKVGLIVGDFGNIELAIAKYRLSNNDALPPNLAALGFGNLRDPWNQAYVYLPFDASTSRAQMRKDRNLVPINSDYDLYSVGEDGDTVPPLTARPSRDDIVRAADGHFIGLAADY